MKFKRKTLYRSAPVFAALFMIMLLCSSIVLADVVTGGTINGNTINFGAFGLTPDSYYHIKLTKVSGGQSNSYGVRANHFGEIKGSGTTGPDKLKPGDEVRIEVYDEGNNPIAGDFITKEMDKEEDGAPWYAYTGVGTIIYYLFGN